MLVFTPSLRSPSTSAADTEDLPVEPLPSSTPAEPFPLPDDGPPLEADLGGKSLESDLRAAEGPPRELVVGVSLGLERGGCDRGLTALGDSGSPRELGVAGALKPVAGASKLPQREDTSPDAIVVVVQRHNQHHDGGHDRWDTRREVKGGRWKAGKSDDATGVLQAIVS